MSRVAIIGSGFLGLTLAHRLTEKGNDVTMFESSDSIGGLASVWTIGSVVWDKHYHVTLLSDAYTRKMAGDLGLTEEFEWRHTRTGFYTESGLVSMSNAFEFLRFPVIGLFDKLRLGATIYYASKIKEWKNLENITVSEWLIKLSGRNTFNKIWRPLLQAKLGDAYKDTSAAFIWATIQRLYAARNSGMQREMFGYVRGGYARVLAEYERMLRKKGVKIFLNSDVRKISRGSTGQVSVEFAEIRTNKAAVASGGQNSASTMNDKPNRIAGENFDSVILTCPAKTAETLLPQLSPGERQRMMNIRYQGIVCASMLLKRPISDFYVTNIIEDSPFTGIIEMTALVDRDEFDGLSLVYLPKYAAPDDSIFELSDTEIRERFIGALLKMYPDLDASDVVEFKISRVRSVFPIPVLGYSDELPPMRTSIEGVYVVNSAHIVNGTLNVNETIQLGERFCHEFFSAEVPK